MSLIFLTTLLVLAAITYSAFLKILEDYEKKRVYYAVMLVLDGLVLVVSTSALLATSTSLKSAPLGGRAKRTLRPSARNFLVAKRAACSPGSSPSAQRITS